MDRISTFDPDRPAPTNARGALERWGITQSRELHCGAFHLRSSVHGIVSGCLGGFPIKFTFLMSELRRRHVVKNALLYLATSWLLLQTADVLFPALRIESWAFPLLIGLLTLFFVPALIFSWIYEMTPEGLNLEKNVEEHGSQEKTTSGIKIDKVVAVLLVIAIAAVVVDRLVPESVAPSLGLKAAADRKPPDGPAPAQSVAEVGSIAVLSFINVGDEPGAESFGDGISEQVLTLLAHTHELKVTSRSSSFALTGQNLNTHQLGDALDVANLVEGSVHYFDGQIRITAQLVDTACDRILWSETYDSPLINELIVQGHIAAEIAAAVKTTLLAGGLVSEVTCPS